MGTLTTDTRLPALRPAPAAARDPRARGPRQEAPARDATVQLSARVADGRGSRARDTRDPHARYQAAAGGWRSGGALIDTRA
jgi:hypothetical protein